MAWLGSGEPWRVLYTGGAPLTSPAGIASRHEQNTCAYRGIRAVSAFSRDQQRWQRRDWRVDSQALAHGGAVRTRKEGLFHGARYTAMQVITVVYERDRP